MRNFLIDPSQIKGEKVALTAPSEIHHLLDVLRLGVGGEVLLLDGKGTRYFSRIQSVSRRKIELEILSSSRDRGESRTKIVLAQGLIKRPKMDFIVEKAVEFGVTEIIPLKTARTVIDGGTVVSRQKRWLRITGSAAKQSGRSLLPAISPVRDLAVFLQECDGSSLFLLTPDPVAPNFAEVLQKKREWGKKVCLLIGPEGGWMDSEKSQILQRGAEPVRLSEATLRSETAVIAALALLTAFLNR